MASSPEHRGESVRITWLLGGNGAKQSCTFSGPYEARLKLALAAKDLVEARRHNITRAECYAAILGKPAEPTSAEPTLAAWSKEWIKVLRRRGRPQPLTVNRYERCLRQRVLPFLGQYRLSAIDQATLEEWVAWLKRSRVLKSNGKPGKERLSANTIRWCFGVLNSCLGAAVGAWISVNPAATPQGQRSNNLGVPAWEKHDATFLSAEETNMILWHCHPDLYDIVFVALRTGMRRGELMALRVRDVVFSRSGGATIMVRLGRKYDGTTGEPKTETSKRDITVKDAAAEILRRRTSGRRPSDPVFTYRPKRVPRRSTAPRRWQHPTLTSHWSRAVAAAQRCPEHPPPLPAKPRRGPRRGWRPAEVSTCGCEGVLRRRPRFHDTRHTHASALIAQGWHVKKIQRRLGHATFAITMDIYGHLMDLGDDGELDSMEAFFSADSRSAEKPIRRSIVQRESKRQRVRVRTALARR